MTDDEWTCPHCGSTDPHGEKQISDELTVDVTCQTVYLIHDETMGLAFDHDEFEAVIDHYRTMTHEQER